MVTFFLLWTIVWAGLYACLFPGESSTRARLLRLAAAPMGQREGAGKGVGGNAKTGKELLFAAAQPGARQHFET